MLKRHFIFFAFLCAWLLPSFASGAPFCLESQGVPAECLYHDIRSCKQEALKRSGHCSVNLDEISAADQGSPFCIVDSSMQPVCAYQHGESCDEEAAKRNAVCFENTGAEGDNDPYRFDRPPFR